MALSMLNFSGHHQRMHQYGNWMPDASCMTLLKLHDTGITETDPTRPLMDMSKMSSNGCNCECPASIACIHTRRECYMYRHMRLRL